MLCILASSCKVKGQSSLRSFIFIFYGHFLVSIVVETCTSLYTMRGGRGDKCVFLF